MEKFVIVDGNNLMFRAFYALPQLANFQGEISNAVFGFSNMIIKTIYNEAYNPTKLHVFDIKGNYQKTLDVKFKIVAHFKYGITNHIWNNQPHHDNQRLYYNSFIMLIPSDSHSWCLSGCPLSTLCWPN